MLIILLGVDLIRDRRQIDQFISAELPDEETDPELFKLVKSHMIHGPCGTINPNCVCMEGGKWVFFFLSNTDFILTMLASLHH